MSIGIDLGTTYSLIAELLPDGRPRVFPDYNDSNLFKTSSTLLFSSGRCLVGQKVEELELTQPLLNPIRFVKLRMGESATLTRDCQGQEWNPTGLSALLVKKLLNDARAQSFSSLERAVISVPAHFNHLERQATRMAGLLAGLRDVTLIDEPVAAATFYGRMRAKQDKTLLIFDLGGGTLDITVLHTDEGGMYATSKMGAKNLGGKNFDEVIMEMISEQCQQDQGFDPLEDLPSLIRLRREAESIKRSLSAPEVTSVQRMLLLNGRVQEVLLTRSLFEQAARPLVSRCRELTEQTLAASHLDWGDIDEILMAGGSSMLPAMREMLVATSGKKDSEIVIERPHEAIAFGAALAANSTVLRSTSGEPLVVQNIPGYDLGIRVVDPVSRVESVDVVVHRHQPLPCRQSKVYYTARGDQRKICFEVVQVLTSVDSLTRLGGFEFEIEHPRDNYPVELSMEYDEMGCVTVSARDPQNGRSMQRVIEDEERVNIVKAKEMKSRVENTLVN